MAQAQIREKWVDEVKLFACILVTMGHFLQSMVNSGILSEGFWYSWFNRTIYYFHVPLFFVCSGYLYQARIKRNRRVDFLKQKGITLVVPYVTFSALSWMLKHVFAGSVNRQNAGFLYSLLVKPVSPYWYLYTLFFLFLVVPRFFDKKSVVFCGISAVFLKSLRVFGLMKTGIYAVDSVMDNMLWFVLGMLFCLIPEDVVYKIKKRKAMIGISAGVFVLTSLLISIIDFEGSLVDTGMGIWGCITVVLSMRYRICDRNVVSLTKFLVPYTMPIFLMHTIFAASLRIALLKLGVTTPTVHIILGITVSFVCPIIATMAMEKLKLDILIYPGKYFVKLKNKESPNG